MCRVPSYDTQATATWEVLWPNAATANCSRQEALCIGQGHNYTPAKGKSCLKKKKKLKKKAKGKWEEGGVRAVELKTFNSFEEGRTEREGLVGTVCNRHE